jgi:hypothetical protein
MNHVSTHFSALLISSPGSLTSLLYHPSHLHIPPPGAWLAPLDARSSSRRHDEQVSCGAGRPQRPRVRMGQDQGVCECVSVCVGVVCFMRGKGGEEVGRG